MLDYLPVLLTHTKSVWCGQQRFALRKDDHLRVRSRLALFMCWRCSCELTQVCAVGGRDLPCSKQTTSG